jgi:hypothetical protein
MTLATEIEIARANARDKAIAFFIENAAYGYDPKTETAAQGRERGARLLAAAESLASARGWTFEWADDSQPCDCDCDCAETWPEVCIARSGSGARVGCLGGICGATREYKRVVQAELALEHMDWKEGD